MLHRILWPIVLFLLQYVSVAGDNLIFGFADNLPIGDIQIFVESYVEVAQDGTQLVLAMEHCPSEVSEYLEPYSIRIHTYTVEDDFLSQIGIKLLRFLIAAEYIETHFADFTDGHTLLTDVSDVFFQRDPFSITAEGDIYFAFEEDRVTIGDSEFNREIITQLFNGTVLKELEDKQISCSGTVFGKTPAILSYLEQMYSLMLRQGVVDELNMGLDQAAHMYLYYTETVIAGEFNNTSGPIFTAGYCPKWPDRWMNHEHKIVNGNGDVAHVVHQYDRHDAMLQVSIVRWTRPDVTGLVIPVPPYSKWRDDAFLVIADCHGYAWQTVHIFIASLLDADYGGYIVCVLATSDMGNEDLLGYLNARPEVISYYFEDDLWRTAGFHRLAREFLLSHWRAPSAGLVAVADAARVVFQRHPFLAVLSRLPDHVRQAIPDTFLLSVEECLGGMSSEEGQAESVMMQLLGLKGKLDTGGHFFSSSSFVLGHHTAVTRYLERMTDTHAQLLSRVTPAMGFGSETTLWMVRLAHNLIVFGQDPNLAVSLQNTSRADSMFWAGPFRRSPSAIVHKAGALFSPGGNKYVALVDWDQNYRVSRRVITKYTTPDLTLARGLSPKDLGAFAARVQPDQDSETPCSSLYLAFPEPGTANLVRCAEDPEFAVSAAEAKKNKAFAAQLVLGAHTLRNKGRLEDAFRAVAASVFFAPADYEGLVLAARLHREAEAGLHSVSRSFLQQAAAVAPEDPVALWREDFLLAPNSYIEDRGWDAVDDLLQMYPDDAAVAYHAAMLMPSANRSDDALLLLQRAAVLRGDDEELWRACGTVAYQTGNEVIALRCMQNAVRTAPRSVPAWNNLCNLLRLLKRYDESIPCLEKLIDMGVDVHKSYKSIAYALWNLGHPRKAIPYYDRAIADTPTCAECFFSRGHVHTLLGDHETAQRDYLRGDYVAAELWGLQLAAAKQRAIGSGCVPKVISLASAVSTPDGLLTVSTLNYAVRLSAQQLSGLSLAPRPLSSLLLQVAAAVLQSHVTPTPSQPPEGDAAIGAGGLYGWPHGAIGSLGPTPSPEHMSDTGVLDETSCSAAAASTPGGNLWDRCLRAGHPMLFRDPEIRVFEMKGVLIGSLGLPPFYNERCEILVDHRDIATSVFDPTTSHTFENIARVAEPVILPYLYNYNYYHGLLESLPSILLALVAVNPGGASSCATACCGRRVVLPRASSPSPSYLSQLLSLVPDAESCVSLVDGGPLLFDDVVYVDWGHSLLPPSPPYSRFYPPRPALLLAREYLSRAVSGAGPRLSRVGEGGVLLFLPRPAPEDGGSRGLASDTLALLTSAVHAAADAAGLEAVVHSEDLPLAEQIEIFSRVVVAVGPHGAGLSNMLFFPPGSALVELPVFPLQQNYYAHAAAALGVHYTVFPAIHSSHNGPVEATPADCEALAVHLARVARRIQGSSTTP